MIWFPASTPARSLIGLTLGCALLAAACSGSVTIDQAQRDTGSETPQGQRGQDQLFTGRYEWEDSSCEFSEPANVATTCGWLEVPQHWDAPDDSASVRLHVGIFSAGPTDTEPVVYLEGGPGGDALANLDQGFDTLFGALVDHQDIIVLGQRGTGSAEPHLQCDEVLELSRELLDEAHGVEEEVDLYAPAYRACATGFSAAEIDTSAYNSVQNAHDVEALRLALGHDRWNVLGISYGTRLGQTLIRLHPDGIRSAILDSVLSMDRDPAVDQPVTAKRAFETLWAGCAASPACSGAFPDLEERFFAQVDRLDESPIRFEVSDLVTGERLPALMTGDGLLGQGFQALYSKSGFAGLPELVAQLEVGETSGIESMVSQTVTAEDSVAIGMFWSVECHEEVPFVTDESIAEGKTGDPRYDRLNPADPAALLEGLCTEFDAGVAAPEENEPVVSDVPVLVLAGEYDPITPPVDGEGILAGFTNGHFVELPHTGHAAIIDDCGAAISQEFFADPSTLPDTSCVAAVPEPAWVAQPFADVTFEPFSYDAGFVSASGVVPTGGDDLGDGVYAWQENALHVSVILQQVAPPTPSGVLLDSLSAAFGSELVEVEQLAVGGRDWTRYEALIPGSIVDLLLADDGDNSLFVLLQHAPPDRDAALDTLVEPLLAAIGP